MYLVSILPAFFITNTFISNARLQLAKNQANTKQHPEAKLSLFQYYSHFQPRSHLKTLGRILQNKQKSNYVIIHEAIRLIIMIMKIKMKNRSHRYDMNRPRPRHGHKYSKYKNYPVMMLHICVKQHLSNIWSSIHEKAKQHWGWVEKKSCFWKNRVIIKIQYWNAYVFWLALFRQIFHLTYCIFPGVNHSRKQNIFLNFSWFLTFQVIFWF